MTSDTDIIETPKSAPVTARRHRLFRRETPESKFELLRTFKIYRKAVEAGQQECGHGKFLVNTEIKVGMKWVESAPTLAEVESLQTDRGNP